MASHFWRGVLDAVSLMIVLLGRGAHAVDILQLPKEVRAEFILGAAYSPGDIAPIASLHHVHAEDAGTQTECPGEDLLKEALPRRWAGENVFCLACKLRLTDDSLVFPKLC